MSKKSDAALAASMSVRRKPESIAADIATTVLGQAAAQVQAPIMIPLDQLRTSKYQPRSLDQAHINQLAESIDAEGLLTPIVVRPVEGWHSMPAPEYEIIAGHHRAAAVKQLGETVIPSVVRTLSDIEAAAALTAENMVRKDLNDYELYKTIVMLKEIEEISDVKLSRILGFARTKVRGLGDFAELPKEAHAILEKRPDLIGYNLMGKLAPYCKSHPALVLEAIERVDTGEINQAGVLGYIERRIAGEATKAKVSEVSWKENGVDATLKYSDTGAKLTGNLDYSKVRKLIEANLESLRRDD